MKNLLFLCLFLVLRILSVAQTNTPDAFVSGGGEFVNGYAQVLWTIGDFQTNTYEQNDLVLTQGFLQSDLTVTNTLSFQETSGIEIKVFPNPVTDVLNILKRANGKQTIYWELYNQKGQVLKANMILSDKTTRIDFSSFENGVYYIRAFTTDGGYLKVFKLVYLN